MVVYECSDSIDVNEIVEGIPVYFMGINGGHEREKASKMFEVGQQLIILDYNINNLSAYLSFENVQGEYNSVMFSKKRPTLVGGGTND